jgi:GntR family transcriptional regulator
MLTISKGMSEPPVDPVGGTSLSHRVREAILDSILERRFEDSRLPPEKTLATMLAVSRTTVRSALLSLEQHGVITRSPRRGTQVNEQMSPSMVALQRLIGFARLLEERGYKVSSIVKVTREEAPSTQVVHALKLEAGASCYRIDRTLVASGRPAIWAIDHFPTALLAASPRVDRLGASPFEMGEALLGGPIHHALVDVVPGRATSEVAQHLGLKSSEPYLLLKETHFSESGLPLGYSLIHVNDHFVRFQLHRRATGV